MLDLSLQNIVTPWHQFNYSVFSNNYGNDMWKSETGVKNVYVYLLIVNVSIVQRFPVCDQILFYLRFVSA